MRESTTNKDGAEKIIAKIKKVLELSRNNPSEEEAKSAALKAQKLMAQYHIDMTEVDGVEDVESITETEVYVGNGKKWKYTLASIVARNFRCRTFYYGKQTVVFYGYETDTKIATETFKYLFKIGNTASDTYYNQLYWKAHNAGEYFDGRGIVNNYLLGYMSGIKDSLDKQCTALMIVIPKEVNASYEEKSKDWKHSIKGKLNTASWYGQQARENGYNKGRNVLNEGTLEMA